ncbi:hypothetical protein B0186_05450 [Canicola haemoglobinophilus]|nr:hypothetical protein B0186_05450 [Canicola haemoglobinophilus]
MHFFLYFGVKFKVKNKGLSITALSSSFKESIANKLIYIIDSLPIYWYISLDFQGGSGAPLK